MNLMNLANYICIHVGVWNICPGDAWVAQVTSSVYYDDYYIQSII